MPKLRAAIDGCEIEIRFDSPEDLTDEIREALAGVAEALAAQSHDDADEVVGFGGLSIGGLRGAPITGSPLGYGCCGFHDGGGTGDTTCTWYTRDSDDDPIATGCTIYTV